MSDTRIAWAGRAMKRLLIVPVITALVLCGQTVNARADDTTTLTAAAEAKADQTPRLGQPTSAFTTRNTFGLIGVYRTYQHGVVAATSRGAYVIESGLQATWNPDQDGWPAQDTQKIGRVSGHTGAAAYFVKPSLGSALEYGAGYAADERMGYFVSGRMFQRFATLHGLGGVGWPTSAETPLPRCGTSSQRFGTMGTLTPDTRWCPAAPYANPYLAQAGNGSGNVQYPGYNGTAVYLMQRAIGMNPGKIADHWGTGTQSALDAFLKKRGYPRVKKLTASVWNRLKSPYSFNVSTWVAPLLADVSATRDQHIAAAIDFAESNLGVSYLWGATGNPGASVGYDCAGLILQALRAGGLNVTKVSNWYDQYPPSDLSNKMLHDNELQPVGSLKSLQPGDLLFTGTYDSNGAAHARHVMMYIGNGMTIQAIHSGVVYVPLYTKGRVYTGGWPYLVGIRRPFATTQVSSSSNVVSVPRVDGATPLASLPRVPARTYWGLNSWAVALPEQKAGVFSGPAWRVVSAQDRVIVGGAGTVIFAGGGKAVAVVTGARGSYPVPSGASFALWVSPADAVGVTVGSPVMMAAPG